MIRILSILTAGFAQKFEQGGKCKPLPKILDFDKSRYAGIWHEQLRYDYPAQKKDSKCTTVEYGPLDDRSVTVKNAEIDPKYTEDGLKWALGYVYGKATQVEPETFPNRLYVSFNFSRSRDDEAASFADVPSNYDVYETDYENYAVVMTCTEFRRGTSTFAWILARDRHFRETPMYREVVVRAKELYGLDPTAPQVIEVSHEDCTWDYIEYCEDKDCENLKPDKP